MKKMYALLLVAALPIVAAAQGPFTGDVDSTFGTNGSRTYSDNLMSREYFYARAVDTANNRIYFIGSTTMNGNIDGYVLCTDLGGTPVTTYGNNGVVVMDASLGGSDIFFCAQLQPDGKLVLGGYTVGSGIDMLLVRLNTDGTADATFNGNGFKTYTTPGNNTDVIRDLTIDNNGNIMIAGYVKANGNEDMIIGRFLPNGDLDVTFGNNGFAKLTLATNESFYKITHLSNNGYMAAGNSDSKLIVVKIANGGLPDATFGSNGIVTIVEPNAGLQPNALIETGNGNIFIGGTAFTNANGPNAFVIKMKANGSFDTKFAGGGKYFAPYGSASIDTVISADDILLMNDGSILISGSYNYDAVYDASLVKIDSNGNADMSFGDGGLRRYHADANRKEGTARMAMLSDGTVLLMGQSSNANSTDLDMMVTKLKAPEKPTGIAHVRSNNEWLLYPNPCHDRLNIRRTKSDNGAATATIVDVQGRVIAQLNSRDMQGEVIALDKYIQHAAKGLYMLSVATKDERFTATFIKD